MALDRSIVHVGCMLHRLRPVVLEAERFVASCSAPAVSRTPECSRQFNQVETMSLLAASRDNYTPSSWRAPSGSHAWTAQRTVQTSPWPSRKAPSFDPAQITSLIKQSGSAQEVLAVMKKHGKNFNHIHVAATLTHAARLAVNTQKALQGSSSPKAQPPPQNPPELSQRQLHQLMLQLSGPFIRNLGVYSSRELANCLWAFAKLQLQPPPELLPAVAEVSSWG